MIDGKNYNDNDIVICHVEKTLEKQCCSQQTLREKR